MEKLRWAEKEWRELDRDLVEASTAGNDGPVEDEEPPNEGLIEVGQTDSRIR